MKVVTKENSSITYYIDEDKRTIVCKMTDCENDFMKSVPDISLSGYELKPYYLGKAKCHPDDIWDEEKGKQLALYRMLQKYYTDRARYSDELLSTVKNQYDLIQKIHAFNLNKLAHYVVKHVVKFYGLKYEDIMDEDKTNVIQE